MGGRAQGGPPDPLGSEPLSSGAPFRPDNAFFAYVACFLAYKGTYPLILDPGPPKPLPSPEGGGGLLTHRAPPSPPLQANRVFFLV